MLRLFPELSRNTIDTFPLFAGADTLTRVLVSRLIGALVFPKNTKDVLERLNPDNDTEVLNVPAKGVKLLALGAKLN